MSGRRPVLTHHISTGTGPDAVWSTTDTAGHPPIGEAAEAALRRRVLGMDALGDDPTKWWHTEGWAAVTDLHRAGLHDRAGCLAVLLVWCDAQFNARVNGYWEIRWETGNDTEGN